MILSTVVLIGDTTNKEINRVNLIENLLKSQLIGGWLWGAGMVQW